MRATKQTRQQEADTTSDEHAPRKLTLAENILLTIKIFVVAGILGAALWGIKLWTSAR